MSLAGIIVLTLGYLYFEFRFRNSGVPLLQEWSELVALLVCAPFAIAFEIVCRLRGMEHEFDDVGERAAFYIDLARIMIGVFVLIGVGAAIVALYTFSVGSLATSVASVTVLWTVITWLARLRGAPRS